MIKTIITDQLEFDSDSITLNTINNPSHYIYHLISFFTHLASSSHFSLRKSFTSSSFPYFFLFLTNLIWQIAATVPPQIASISCLIQMQSRHITTATSRRGTSGRNKALSTQKPPTKAASRTPYSPAYTTKIGDNLSFNPSKPT